MRLPLTIIALACLVAASYAATSANYGLDPTTFDSGGTKSSSESFVGQSKAGLTSGERIQTSFYNILSGFLAFLTKSQDTTPPTISKVLFDGREAKDKEYISKNAIWTATILDNPGGSGIDPAKSKLTIDGAETLFSKLVTDSQYNVTTGALTYNLNLTDGSHTLKLQVYDRRSNQAAYQIDLQVDSGVVKALPRGSFPNPWAGSGYIKIGYQLSKDANIKIYVFDALNHPVWVREYLAGANGGSAGYNEIDWNGITDFNEVLPNGAYFLRIVADGKLIGKMNIAVVK